MGCTPTGGTGPRPRLDISWRDAIALREDIWHWRHDTTSQVVNPDIDGLLTACLLHHLKGWPVTGFYDTRRLYVDARANLPLDMRKVAWVDVDMTWPGARSVSQHVVLEEAGDAERVLAYAETVNPSLQRRHSRRGNYRDKYPFGTFQWVWWLAALGDLPDPEDAVTTGLAWMPDGGFLSVRNQWRRNCVHWAVRQLPGSILSPLAMTDPDRAWDAVKAAEKRLISLSGVRDGWSNHQFNLTSGSSSGPVLRFPLDEVPGVLQAVCDAITHVYGWTRLALPSTLTVVEGSWRTASRPPPRWPEAANRHEVVSLAVTGGRQVCWTEPGDLAEALPGTRLAGRTG